MFTDRQVVFKVLLVNPPKRTQEVTHGGPQTLDGVDVDLADAIAIIVPCPFLSAMTDRTVRTPDARIALPLVRIATGRPLGVAVDMGAEGGPIGMLSYP